MSEAVCDDAKQGRRGGGRRRTHLSSTQLYGPNACRWRQLYREANAVRRGSRTTVSSSMKKYHFDRESSAVIRISASILQLVSSVLPMPVRFTGVRGGVKHQPCEGVHRCTGSLQVAGDGRRELTLETIVCDSHDDLRPRRAKVHLAAGNVDPLDLLEP